MDLESLREKMRKKKMGLTQPSQIKSIPINQVQQWEKEKEQNIKGGQLEKQIKQQSKTQDMMKKLKEKKKKNSNQLLVQNHSIIEEQCPKQEINMGEQKNVENKQEGDKQKQKLEEMRKKLKQKKQKMKKIENHIQPQIENNKIGKQVETIKPPKDCIEIQNKDKQAQNEHKIQQQQKYFIEKKAQQQKDEQNNQQNKNDQQQEQQVVLNNMVSSNTQLIKSNKCKKMRKQQKLMIKQMFKIRDNIQLLQYYLSKQKYDIDDSSTDTMKQISGKIAIIQNMIGKVNDIHQQQQ